MEGCNDGTWNGVRYFSCRQGHGFFVPLSLLSPDQRFAEVTIAATNRKCISKHHMLTHHSRKENFGFSPYPYPLSFSGNTVESG